METHRFIQRAIDYIEENLRSELTAEDIAQAAGFSVYHFYHLFASATGLSVMQFVTQRRLRHAACDIAGGKRIIDSALDYGFDSASGFTRAFRREFGLSPREYARSTLPYRPEKFILKELNHIMIPQKLIARALSAWFLTDTPQSIIHSSGVRSENLFRINDRLLHVQQNRSPIALAMAAEECLLKSGLPASRTIPAANGTDILEMDGLFFRLTDEPSGTFIPAREMYEDLSHPRALGQALAMLHRSLEPLRSLPELNHPDLLRSTLEYALPAATGPLHLDDAFIRRYSEQFSTLFPGLHTAVIHRNPTPDAFLFEGGRLSGYAHFEMTEVNIRLFDICYAATAILSETFGRIPAEMVEGWPEVLNSILEGYESVIPLTKTEHEAVPHVVLANQLMCVAYFSGLEKFSSLAEINAGMTRKIISWLFN